MTGVGRRVFAVCRRRQWPGSREHAVVGDPGKRLDDAKGKKRYQAFLVRLDSGVASSSPPPERFEVVTTH